MDARTRDAVERDFEKIGEAMNFIRKHDESTLASITDHRKIIAFRNQLIHGYDIISDPITWDIIETKLPVLRSEVDGLLAGDR